MAKEAGWARLNTAICKALGYEANEVRWLEINVAPGRFPTVTVEHVISHEQADKWPSAIEHYKLVPIEEEDDA